MQKLSHLISLFFRVGTSRLPHLKRRCFPFKDTSLLIKCYFFFFANHGFILREDSIVCQDGLDAAKEGLYTLQVSLYEHKEGFLQSAFTPSRPFNMQNLSKIR